MDVLTIDRIMLVTEDLGAATDRFEQLLGVSFGRPSPSVTEPRDGDEQHMEYAYAEPGIEFITPTADNEVARYLKTYGPGLYGLSLRVADAEAAKRELREQGVEPLMEAHPGDAHEVMYHPKEFEGVYTLFVEYPHPIVSE